MPPFTINVDGDVLEITKDNKTVYIDNLVYKDLSSNKIKVKANKDKVEFPKCFYVMELKESE